MALSCNWGGEGYPEYQGYLKKTSGEQKADTQQFQVTTSAMNMVKTLTNMAKTVFQEQQGLLNNVLIPQLTQWAQHPPGMGVQALAAARAQLTDTIGGQFAMQRQQMNQQFASQNMAGLQSGVQQALGGQLGLQAATAEATGQRDITLANEQMKLQQQEAGMSGLAGATQLLGQAPQEFQLAQGALGVASQSAGQAFNEQYTMAQQGTGFQNFMRGVTSSAALALGAAFAPMTGGASLLAAQSAAPALGGMWGGGGTGPGAFGGGGQSGG